LIRWHLVGRVSGRHFREILRERKTIVFLMISPLLFVILFMIVRDELANQIADQATAVHSLGVEGSKGSPELIAFLRTQRFSVVETGDVTTKLRDGEFPVALLIDVAFDDHMAKELPARVSIMVGERSVKSELARAHLASALNTYSELALQRRLQRAGLPKDAGRPIVVSNVDVTTSRERAGSMLGALLPLIVVSQVLGLMTGIAGDITAGEKDRRTVEALLATPLRRREIAAAKWIVTLSMGLLAGALTLGGALGAFALSGAGTAVGSAIELPAGGAAMAALAIACVVAVMSAVEILIGLAARSAQQASVFMAPLIGLAILPLILLGNTSGSAVAAPIYAIPIIGPLLLARFGMEGTAVAGAGTITTITSLIYVVATLALADRVFRSERAIQRAVG